MSKNKLLTYLFQCRSKEFIESFRKVKKLSSKEELELYSYCYALDIILTDEAWGKMILPVIEVCRKECKVLIDFFKSEIEIPENYDSIFKEMVRKNYQYYYDDDDFEFMLGGDIEKLKELGYREIDCYLFEAGMKLHFEDTLILLKKGGNPFACISADFSASEIYETEYYDGDSLYEEAFSRVNDLCICDEFNELWKNGVKKIDVKIKDTDICGLFMAAGYQLIVNMINKFEYNEKITTRFRLLFNS